MGKVLLLEEVGRVLAEDSVDERVVHVAENRHGGVDLGELCWP